MEPLIGLRGYLIDAPGFGKCRGLRDGAIVMQGGKIVERGEFESLRRKERPAPVQWRAGSNMVLVPGLIDLHTHLPQYPAVGRGAEPLLPWLRQHIFPLERDFNAATARREACLFFEDAARNGTTTIVVCTAIYEESCDCAFQAAEASGLRVLMGKTMMDVGAYGAAQPKKILSISLSETERLFDKWNGAGGGLIDYVVSPRFAVSCSERMLRAAGEFATAKGSYLQTHLSESKEEVDRVRNLFGQARDYTDVYSRFGILGPKSILAHCIHLSADEIRTIADSGSRVAHCPSSDLFLGSGIMRLDSMLEAGISIGLGSSVASGPELSMWRVMRAAVESQQARAFYETETAVPKPAAAFYLATQGAAEALGKGELVGTLDEGKEADIVVLDPARLIPYPKRIKEAIDLPAEELLSLCVYRGGPQAVVETYVRGRCVFQMPHPDLFGAT